jgi:hypothetical protein
MSRSTSVCCAEVRYPSLDEESRTLHKSIEISIVIGGPLDESDRSTEVEMTNVAAAVAVDQGSNH